MYSEGYFWPPNTKEVQIEEWSHEVKPIARMQFQRCLLFYHIKNLSEWYAERHFYVVTGVVNWRCHKVVRLVFRIEQILF